MSFNVLLHKRIIIHYKVKKFLIYLKILLALVLLEKCPHSPKIWMIWVTSQGYEPIWVRVDCINSDPLNFRHCIRLDRTCEQLCQKSEFETVFQKNNMSTVSRCQCSKIFIMHAQSSFEIVGHYYQKNLEKPWL